MALKNEIAELLRIKQELDAAEKAYDKQRLVVRNALIEAGKQSVDQSGYRISRLDDKLVRKFDIAVLREQLGWHYLTDNAIEDIISHSKSESTQKGILRISPLPAKKK